MRLKLHCTKTHVENFNGKSFFYKLTSTLNFSVFCLQEGLGKELLHFIRRFHLAKRSRNSLKMVTALRVFEEVAIYSCLNVF